MTFTENGGRPGDERGFVHRKILGGISKFTSFLPGPAATIVSGITGRLAGSRGKKQHAELVKFGNGAVGFSGLSDPTCKAPFVRNPAGRCVGAQHPSLSFGGQRAPCDFPMVRDAQGNCRMPTSGQFGGEQFGVGEAVMGQYGAALQPGSMIIDRAVCLRGMQLGNDGLCYNKSQITNKQRMWPAGRKPLLTSGDMRAISIASRAARRMEGATKRLQKMGMMKKPSRRAVPAGHVARLTHAEQ